LFSESGCGFYLVFRQVKNEWRAQRRAAHIDGIDVSQAHSAKESFLHFKKWVHTALSKIHISKI
jgi:hypothetical protein